MARSRSHGPLLFGQSCKVSRLSHALPSMPVELAALFTSSTVISMDMRGGTSPAIIQAPVGHLADLELVEIGTTAIIWLTFLYLFRAACRTASRMNARNWHVKVE